jgi:hypothetical protein
MLLKTFRKTSMNKIAKLPVLMNFHPIDRRKIKIRNRFNNYIHRTRSGRLFAGDILPCYVCHNKVHRLGVLKKGGRWMSTIKNGQTKD